MCRYNWIEELLNIDLQVCSVGVSCTPEVTSMHIPICSYYVCTYLYVPIPIPMVQVQLHGYVSVPSLAYSCHTNTSKYILIHFQLHLCTRHYAWLTTDRNPCRTFTLSPFLRYLFRHWFPPSQIQPCFLKLFSS